VAPFATLGNGLEHVCVIVAQNDAGGEGKASRTRFDFGRSSARSERTTKVASSCGAPETFLAASPFRL
jgi:hypothetical protein